MILQPFPIDMSTFRGGTRSAGFNSPAAFSSICPYCGMKAIFSVSSPKPELHSRTVYSSAKCPSCPHTVSVTFYHSEEKNADGDFRMVAAYIFPSPRQVMTTPSLPDEVPLPLQRALGDAINSYNAGIYSATATLGRRALEGLFKSISGNSCDRARLHDLIEESKKNPEISKPIVEISHAVREGGNLGAHFDLEREADEETARHIVELVIYLVGYFYLIPKKVQELEMRVK